MSSTLILGHRGASAEAIENTVGAMRLAGRQGADGVEFDVRLCASGEVVVFHDRDLVRLAGRHERVEDLTLENLREVRLGLAGRAEDDVNIPTLDEVMRACAGMAMVNVEVKVDRGGEAAREPLVREVVRVLAAGDTTSVIVSSFDAKALDLVSRVAPRLALGVLFEPHEIEAGEAAEIAARVRAVAIHPHHGVVTAAAMAAWQGYAVNVWTVDDPARARELAALGVHSLISNAPGTLRASMEKLAAGL